MALTDYSATAAAPLAPFGRLISWLRPAARQHTKAVEASPAKATPRPAHEANYLADIGMEIGF